MNDLIQLAELLKCRNTVDAQISALIQRPALTGHIGEYIASSIFGIVLRKSASHKGNDGHFPKEPLAGHSVNIKIYPKHDGLLAISPKELPDFILVLAGPKSAATSSRGQYRPCIIESVFLFDAHALVAELKASNAKLSEATSVRQHLWRQAEIYPSQRNDILVLSEEQRAALALFNSVNCA
jgi:hypothetical protein